jgi:hypothetical protein
MGDKKVKKVVFTTLVILVTSVRSMAQSGPIMGYDQVTWGSSVQAVRSTYNIALEPAADDANIMVLKQNDVSNSIKECQFMFNGDRLYRVWIFYKDWSDSTKNNLQSVLENRFGGATNFDTKTQQTMLAFQIVCYRTNTIVFGKYSPDLYIEMIQGVLHTSSWEMDTMNLLGQNQLSVCYTWKKFRDEYQASKLGL